MKKLVLVLVISLISGCANTIGFFRGGQPIEDDRSKRTLGTVVDDEVIETKALVNIKNADEGFKKSRIIVTSYNGIVLLAGQVPNDNLKQIAEQTILSLQKVRKVYNYLTITPPIGKLRVTDDSWLTTKIKSYMVGTRGFSAKKVKVVTENAVVYLMGIVTKEQADQAVAIVQQIYGVERIVKLFEYV